jgi:uncharacterized protein (DUF427 family)
VIRASFNGVVLAETDKTVKVEGNHYFPPESLHTAHLRSTRTRTLCPWKGIARYYDVVIDGVVNPNAAWYYPHPSPFARRIRNHVAFWHGVEIEIVDQPSGRLGTLDAGGDEGPRVGGDERRQVRDR